MAKCIEAGIANKKRFYDRNKPVDRVRMNVSVGLIMDKYCITKRGVMRCREMHPKLVQGRTSSPVGFVVFELFHNRFRWLLPVSTRSRLSESESIGSLQSPSPSPSSSCFRFAVAISAACFLRHFVRRFWNHTCVRWEKLV
uniref:Uncharacterized protein n=1 Tax=Anopheles farauti TaxID=69004 RepID=A0A182QKE0_9DIPT